MPYSIDRKNKCVYKKKPDGSRGKKVGCTKGPLKKYLAALYVNEQGCCKKSIQATSSIKLRKIMESVDFEDVFNELGTDNSLDLLKKGYSGSNDDSEYDDDDYDSVDTDSEEFKEFVYNIYDELYSSLYDYIDSDTVRLYRYISVDEDGLKKIFNGGVSLGIYWTYDKDSAQQYWGNDKDYQVLLVCDVNNEYIDWIKTFTVKLEVDLADDEKEIRLKKDKPIKLVNLYVNNNNMLDKVKNNKFTS